MIVVLMVMMVVMVMMMMMVMVMVDDDGGGDGNGVSSQHKLEGKGPAEVGAHKRETGEFLSWRSG